MRLLFWSLLLGGVTANAATIVFSDLGTGGSVYTADQSEIGSQGQTNSNIEHASLFTASGSGLFDITQIDVGVAEASGFTGTFRLSLWTNSGGVPGTQLGSWDLSTTNPAFSCCALATVSGITGVTVTGGTQYFLEMSPQAFNDGSKVYWQPNSFGTTHTALGRVNGGSWVSDPGAKVEAYDLLGAPAGVPEPASWCLTAVGLGMVAMLRRKTLRRSGFGR